MLTHWNPNMVHWTSLWKSCRFACNIILSELRRSCSEITWRQRYSNLPNTKKNTSNLVRFNDVNGGVTVILMVTMWQWWDCVMVMMLTGTHSGYQVFPHFCLYEGRLLLQVRCTTLVIVILCWSWLWLRGVDANDGVWEVKAFFCWWTLQARNQAEPVWACGGFAGQNWQQVQPRQQRHHRAFWIHQKSMFLMVMAMMIMIVL